MKFYAEHLFPRLMGWMMSGEAFQRLRVHVLKAPRILGEMYQGHPAPAGER